MRKVVRRWSPETSAWAERGYRAGLTCGALAPAAGQGWKRDAGSAGADAAQAGKRPMTLICLGGSRWLSCTGHYGTLTCGGLTPSELKRLRQLEEENGKLKNLVADLSLDK